MKRKIALICAVLMVVLAGSLVQAQCPEEYTVHVGTSQCIHVCFGQLVNVNLEGSTFWSVTVLSYCEGCFCLTFDHQAPGPQGVPVLIMLPGCQNPPHCLEQCNPVPPPPALVLGGDPNYPLDYFGLNNCMIVYMHFDHYLAAELQSFTALPGNHEVRLDWQTASELRNDHFEIVRDGAKVGQVAAMNLPTVSNYTWTDHTVVNGQAYSYTLVAVDMDGQRSELQTINNVIPNGTEPGIVTAYALYQNYPNPFNPETSIAFDLVQEGNVTLAIYNVLGEKVSTLLSDHMNSGHHSVVFSGSNLSTGVYLYKLEVNGFSSMKKLVLLK